MEAYKNTVYIMYLYMRRDESWNEGIRGKGWRYLGGRMEVYTGGGIGLCGGVGRVRRGREKE